MSDALELLALAERCEREEPSNALDQAIWAATKLVPGTGGWQYYTTSLDAAVTLVPEGDCAFWRLGSDGEGADPADFRAQVLIVDPERLSNTSRSAIASTAALALCAAALKARAALTEQAQASNADTKAGGGNG